MTHDIVDGQDGTTVITVDFADEGVELQGSARVKGGLDAARNYLPVFERDLRTNFADLFPVSEPEPGEDGEGGDKQ